MEIHQKTVELFTWHLISYQNLKWQSVKQYTWRSVMPQISMPRCMGYLNIVEAFDFLEGHQGALLVLLKQLLIVSDASSLVIQRFWKWVVTNVPRQQYFWHTPVCYELHSIKWFIDKFFASTLQYNSALPTWWQTDKRWLQTIVSLWLILRSRDQRSEFSLALCNYAPTSFHSTNVLGPT